MLASYERVVKGSKRSGNEGRGERANRIAIASTSRRRESISSSLSLRVILPLTRPRFSAANHSNSQIFAGKYLKRNAPYSLFHNVRLSVLLVTGLCRASPSLTQRSMRIYILSRGGIVCAPIFLCTPRVPNSSNVTSSCEALTLTICFLRRKAAHLDSTDGKKRVPMKYAWDIKTYLSARIAPLVMRLRPFAALSFPIIAIGYSRSLRNILMTFVWIED